MKVRSKHSIAGDVIITKGQILDMDEPTAAYWVANGLGELYVDPEAIPVEAKIIPASEQNPEAVIIETAAEKTITEKAIKGRPVKKRR